MNRSVGKALQISLIGMTLGCGPHVEGSQAATMATDTLEVFSYDRFGKSSVRFTEIDLNKHPVRTIKDDRGDSLEVIDLASTPACAFMRPIQHGVFTGRNAVRVGTSTFDIDSLMASCCGYTSGQVVNALTSVSTFTFGGSSYVAFFLQDLSNPIIDPNTLLLLFDATDPERVHCIPAGFQASVDPRCLGDFNGDGTLDLAYWMQGDEFQDTLSLLSLRSGSFQRVAADHQLHIVRQHDGYYVDRKASTWNLER